MECPELTISVGELISVPKISLRGTMDGWHEHAVKSVLVGLREQGNTSVVLDMAGVQFAGFDGATAMINTLRSLGPEMGVHVVASGAPANLLGRAQMGPCVKLYASTDEIAEYLTPDEDMLTSRWMASSMEDTELPLAA